MLNYFAQCATSGVALGVGVALIKEELRKPAEERSYGALIFGLASLTAGLVSGVTAKRLKSRLLLR